MSVHRSTRPAAPVTPALVALCLSTSSISGQERLTWEEVARTGMVGSEVEFQAIRDIVVWGPLIFVADSRSDQIRILSDDLAPRGSFGRSGGGPGEFRSLYQMNRVSDSLFVFDPTLSRLSRFLLPDGRFVDSDGPPTGPEYAFRHAPEAGLADGMRLVRHRDSLSVFDPVSRTISFLAGFTQVNPYARISVQRLRATVRKPVNESSLRTVGAGGRVIALLHQPLPKGEDQVAAELVLLSPRGDTLSNFRLPVPGQRIPEEGQKRIADAAMRFARTSAAQYGIPWVELRDAYLEAMSIPEFQVPFERLLVTEGGNLALRRGSFGETEAEWMIVSSDGRVKSTFTLPESLEVLAIAGEKMWATTTGEWEEPVLVALRARSVSPVP